MSEPEFPQLRQIAERIEAQHSRGTPIRIVIDGPSGSGKTAFAAQLARRLEALCPQGLVVLNVEEWVPGWKGLAQGTATAEALMSGRTHDYVRWNWAEEKWAETVSPPTDFCWILEGCGTLTPTTAQAATFSIWIATDPATAKARGLERDGEAYAPFWQEWHDQERIHWQEHRPWALADAVVAT